MPTTRPLILILIVKSVETQTEPIFVVSLQAAQLGILRGKCPAAPPLGTTLWHITERKRKIARRGIQTYDFTVFSFIGGHLNQLTKALIVKCCMCCGYFILFCYPELSQKIFLHISQ